MNIYSALGMVGALVFGIVAAIALVAVWIRTNRHSSVVSRALMAEAEGSITFLFDDEVLTDATPRARELLASSPDDRSDWENLLSLLSARFPHLRSQCQDLAKAGTLTIKAEDKQAGWIQAEYWQGLARFTLIQDQTHPDETIDPLTAAAMEHELETLRAIGEDSPQLIWKRDAEGVLIWANKAYIELSEALHPLGPNEVLPWPPRNIFDRVPAPSGSVPMIDMHRVELETGGDPTWYEVTSLKRGTDTIHFAVDATAVVTARDAQQNFVQTLTKTFAQLSVGLAIFDAKRQLVLFNPALLDLTALPADFLISRPTLVSFLDRLRDKQMIPEPKNYTNWRNQIAVLEAAAVEGSYHETWLIPNGQTYRVTGKPHPNGAIAFLIEDISDEISLTRKFRSQLDTSTAVLDNIEAAVAVFSSSGSMIMANRAYRDLWGSQPDDALVSRDFTDEIDTWEAASAPSPVWVKLRDSIEGGMEQGPWNETIWLNTHLGATCHYAPLNDGSHQIMFTDFDHDQRFATNIEPLDFEASKSATS